MKIKVYMQDWFYNAGIVGFLRIVDKSKPGRVRKIDNYIEFESDILIDFHDDYFNYFRDVYDIAAKTKERLDKSIRRFEKSF